MSILSVSFKDRLCFEAHNQFSPSSTHSLTLHNASKGQDLHDDKKSANKVNLDFSLLRTRLNSRGISQDGKSSRAWRWVDFSPKCHKNSPRSPKMVHDRRPSLSPPVVVGEKPAGEDNSHQKNKKKSKPPPFLFLPQVLLQHLYTANTVGEVWRGAPTTTSGELDHDGRYASAFNIAMKNKVGGGGRNGLPRRSKYPFQHRLGRGLGAQSAPSVELMKDPFQTRFLLSKAGDDRLEKARERRDFAVYPYWNPKPFDHRGVSSKKGEKERETARFRAENEEGLITL